MNDITITLTFNYNDLKNLQEKIFKDNIINVLTDKVTFIIDDIEKEMTHYKISNIKELLQVNNDIITESNNIIDINKRILSTIINYYLEDFTISIYETIMQIIYNETHKLLLSNLLIFGNEIQLKIENNISQIPIVIDIYEHIKQTDLYNSLVKDIIDKVIDKYNEIIINEILNELE